ncbi:MAG: YqhA family protein [Ilumatobacteraceae bacterium]|nr:YqhA family protein [Ilumatobacteraceae bacterium]MBU6242101.1 YqhA family protein [Acidobacteriota bacterium]
MPLSKVLGPARYIAIIAVIGLLVTSVATFGWSIARTVLFVDDLFQGKWRSDDQVVSLLKTIDTYLLALVQFIIVIGLYELFIGELDVPQWLKIDSLDDLKKSIIDILVIFVAVKGIEGLLKQKDPLDALTFVGASASLILVLTLFRIAKVADKK